MRQASVMLFFLITGCEFPVAPVVDQCMRREIFFQCMKALPAGPAATKYNDWNEVVSECDSVAMYQSLRLPMQVSQECISR